MIVMSYRKEDDLQDKRQCSVNGATVDRQLDEAVTRSAARALLGLTQWTVVDDVQRQNGNTLESFGLERSRITGSHRGVELGLILWDVDDTARIMRTEQGLIEKLDS